MVFRYYRDAASTRLNGGIVRAFGDQRIACVQWVESAGGPAHSRALRAARESQWKCRFRIPLVRSRVVRTVATLPDIKSLTREEIEARFAEWNEPAYRVTQVWAGLHGLREPDELTGLQGGGEGGVDPPPGNPWR